MSRARGRTPAKRVLRDRIWSLLTRRRLGRFPLPLRDRIPNFAGAGQAAERLAALPEWRTARALKCNPDAPQRAVRLRALREGKDVYVAVPRLRAARCFLHLDPRRIPPARLAAAATIGGAAAVGVPTAPEDLPHMDLVVAGSVAVNRRGARVGTGARWSSPRCTTFKCSTARSR
jgi:5-formyltetrahydrofolate cyclo-ligase